MHHSRFAATSNKSCTVSEDEELEEENSPAAIHLPAVFAAANRKRKGAHKSARHAGAAGSLCLPQISHSNQAVMKRNPRAGPHSPHLHPLHPASSPRRPSSHPQAHSFRHSFPLPSHSPLAQHSPSHPAQLTASVQQGPTGPAYVPPLSPLAPAMLRTGAESKSQAPALGGGAAAATAAGAGVAAAAGVDGEDPAGAPMSSLTAAASLVGTDGEGAGGAGSETDDIDKLLAAIGADMEQPGDNGTGMAARLESLPCTLCTSAAGDMYMVGLSDVQHMLHKRKLGPEGLAVLQRFENSVVKPMDALALKHGLIREAQRPPPMVSIHAPTRSRASGTTQGAAKSGSREAPIPSVLQSRIGSPNTKRDGNLDSGSDTKDRRGSLFGRASSMGDGVASTRQPSRQDSGMDVGNLDEDVVDEEVRRHLHHVMELVEQHRLHLHYNNARTLAEQERVAASLSQAAKTQAAIDFVVKRLVPEKIIAMARTRRSRVAKGGRAGAGAKPSLLKHLKDTAAPGDGQAPVDSMRGMGSPRGSLPGLQSLVTTMEQGEEEARSLEPSPVGALLGGKWNTAVSRMNLDKLPFMANWGATIRKLNKQDCVSWDELLNSNQSSLYGGAKGKSQGAHVYIVKCQELGVVPSTQVIQQLRQAECDMAHCKLGRRGAQALRHALAINTSITDLNLTDNGLDALGLAEIVQGLTYGFTARKPRGALGSIPRQGISLDLVQHVPSSTDVNVNVIPPSLRSQVGADSVAQGGTAFHKPSSPTTHFRGMQALLPAQALLQGQGSLQLEQGSLQQEQGSGTPCSPPTSSQLPRSPSPGRKKKQLRVPMEPHRSNVQILDLSLNPLGVNGGRLVAELLDPTITPHQFLVELRMDKCALSETSGLAIANALKHFNRTLRVLSLSNNGIGNKTAAAFGKLLEENTTLTDLDLSWNQIKSEGIKGLRKGLEGSISLKRLSLAWNGLEDEGAVTMGEILIKNASLVHLDLTNTRLGCEACVMIGEGIKANSTLEELFLNGNAIGDDGARHLMAALKGNKSLECLSLQGSNMSTAARGHNGAADFNPLAPEGSYTLALDNPTDRAVAVQLCQFDVISNRGPLIHNIKLNDQPMKPVRELDWPAKMPTSGLLELDFVARKIQNLVQVMDNKKFQAVVFQLESRFMSDVEKLSLVEIIAPFTYLYCHQVATILKCFSMGDELVRAAALLFTRAADLEENIDALTDVMQDHDIRSLQQMLGWFSYCRFSNPTGHFELNLTTPVHQAFAVRLKDVAYGEPSEGSNWFNIVYDMYSHAVKVPSNYGPPDMWKGVIPSRGTVSLDYVSTSRPPPEAQAISDEQLTDFLHDEIGMMFDSDGNIVPETDYSTADLQVALLRQEAGHRFWFLCAQVQRLANGFLAGPHKVEVVVMMWALILDRKNFWTILYSLPPFEQSLLMWRLGPLNVLDKAHPSVHYVLDLSNNLHEQVARRLVDMAAKNPEVPNFWNLRLQGVKKSMPEGSNMWGTLTAETFTPWLEFDFIYLDAWENGVLGKTKADFETMGKFDKFEVVARQAKRMELQRIKAMYGYFYDGSGYAPPLWRTRSQMFKALLEKSPWLAAWDRLMRLLVRLDLRSGDISTDSYIEDIFDSRCSDDGDLTQEAFEAICKDWGYSRGEIYFHFRPAFESAAKPVVRAGNPTDSPQRRAHFSYLPSSRNLAPTSTSGAPSARPSESGSATEAGPTSSKNRLHRRSNSRMNLNTKSDAAVAASPSPQPDESMEEVEAASPAPAKPAPEKMEPVMVIDFATFVSIFMQEPALQLRYKEVPNQTNFAGVQPMSKVGKGMSRKAPDRGTPSRPLSATKPKK